MQTRRARRSLIAGLIFASIVACSQQRSQDESAREASAPPTGMVAEKAAATEENRPAGVPASAPATTVSAAQVAAQLTSAVASSTDAQRKFIRSAHAEFRVHDVYRSSLAIEDIVAAHGGFVVKSDIGAETQDTQRRSRSDGKLIELTEYTNRGTLVVRVPSEKTQAFLLAIVGQVEFLDHRTFEAQDVQFEMLRQQLAYQRSQEAQQDIGQAEQQGGKLDQRTDALQLRDQAKAARDEAQVAQKEFDDRVAFSTIDLSLYETPRIRATEMVDAEAEFQRNSPGFFERLADAARDGWNGFLNVVVGLASVWPLFAVLAIALLMVRFFRTRRSST